MLVASTLSAQGRALKNWAAREPMRDETWRGDHVDTP